MISIQVGRNCKAYQINAKEVISTYNKCRKEHQVFDYSFEELKTMFEDCGLPCSYRYLPSYIKFGIVIKRKKNCYHFPTNPVYYEKIVNALKYTTVRTRKAA